MLGALLLKKSAAAAITLLGVAVVVFVLLRVAPGDPISMMISPGATPEDIAALRARYGLDTSIATQFGIWFAGLVRGDLGTSISLHRNVLELLSDRLPATLELALLALAVAITVGGSAAVLGTVFKDTLFETALTPIVGLLLAVPDFIWALAFVLLFGVGLQAFPLTGRIDPSRGESFTSHFYLVESVIRMRFTVLGDILSHMVMPVFALALPLAAVIARVLKESLAEAMVQDYILMGKVKGFSQTRLVVGEALRNAVAPTLALTGVQFTFLLGGTVIVERIFAYPGIGNMAIDAVTNRDLPLIQGLVLLFGFLFLLLNIGVDLCIAGLNPRLRGV